MKSLSLASLLMSVAALSLQGMDERARHIEHYMDQKKVLSSQVDCLAYSPERDSSIKKVSRATGKGLQRRFGVDTVIPIYWQYARVAVDELTARIEVLQDVAHQANYLMCESQSVLGSVKMAGDFTSINNRAKSAAEALKSLRDDMVNGGTLLAEMSQQVPANLPGKFNPGAASDSLGEEPPIFMLPS